jgi:hypothetical protein
VGVTLQRRQVQLAPMTGRAPFQLLAHLDRQQPWLAVITLATVAYGLQALPLAFGPLSLVPRCCNGPGVCDTGGGAVVGWLCLRGRSAVFFTPALP